MNITKAVFPVAGLGTRFLPATKVVPKEMLPIVDKPIIQYATEEAVRAGVKEIIFVISENKASIREHYSNNKQLNEDLLKKEKHELHKIVNTIIPSDVKCHYADQSQALGLGHAVLCARQFVGNDAFAVILPDDMIDDNSHGCLKQMVDVYNDHQASLIAVENVDPDDTDKYGIVSTTPVSDSIYKIDDIVEKPKPVDAPSTLAVVGRYILSGSIMEILENIGEGAGGEIQLTDGIKQLLASESVYAYRFDGVRYDCGSKLGYLKATINYGLKDQEINSDFAEYLRKLKLK